MSRLWSKEGPPVIALWQKPPTSPTASQHIPDAAPLSPAETRVRNPGKRYAQIVKLKPEHYDEYKRVHAAVWPEVAKQIRNSNIVDCTSMSSSSSVLSSMPRLGRGNTGAKSEVQVDAKAQGLGTLAYLLVQA